MEHNAQHKSMVKKDIPVTNYVLKNYINPDEEVVGFGLGGSESLTIFLKKPGCSETVVRKILSENLITAKWDRDGKDVMLAPYKKAKQQAYYLKYLPASAQPFFPQVSNIIERSVPKTIKEAESVDDQSDECVNELIYDMSYISGDEVSEFIRKYNPPVEVVARLYVVIYHTLNNIVHINAIRKPSGPTLEQSYFSKIEKRLDLSRRTSPNVFSDELLNTQYIYIDGVKHLNVRPLLEKFRGSPHFLKTLEPSRHTIGDGRYQY